MSNQEGVVRGARNLNDGVELPIVTDQPDFHYAVGQQLRLDHLVPVYFAFSSPHSTMTLRQSAMLRYWRHLSVTCALAACTDPLAPGERVPLLGVYDYSMAIPVLAGTILTARSYTGTLTLTYATEDSIAGQWSVPAVVRADGSTLAAAYQPQLQLGFWNEGAYVVWATSGAFTVVHRLEPGKSGLRCDDSGILVGGLLGTRVDGVCLLQLR